MMMMIQLTTKFHSETYSHYLYLYVCIFIVAKYDTHKLDESSSSPVSQFLSSQFSCAVAESKMCFCQLFKSVIPLHPLRPNVSVGPTRPTLVSKHGSMPVILVKVIADRVSFFSEISYVEGDQYAKKNALGRPICLRLPSFNLFISPRYHYQRR